MNKDKENIEKTGNSKKPSKGVSQREEAEIHEDTDELSLLDKIEEPVPMGSTAYISDDTGKSAVRKFMDLRKMKPHSHEIIYNPEKEKSAEKPKETEVSKATPVDKTASEEENAEISRKWEEAEIHEDTDELNLLDKMEKPVPMGSTAYISDDTGKSAVRKFMDLRKTKPHSHEIIYNPKKKATKSEEDKSDQTEQK